MTLSPTPFQPPYCFYLEALPPTEICRDTPVLRLGRWIWLQKLFCWVARKLNVYTVNYRVDYKQVRIEKKKIMDLCREVMDQFYIREGERPKCLVMGRQTANELMGECWNTYQFFRTSTDSEGSNFCGVDICVVPYFEGIVPLKFTDPKGVH